MENVDELKRMILSFRITELALLLAFAGRNKLGKKSDLQKRALELVDTVNSPALHHKIRKLHESYQFQLLSDSTAATLLDQTKVDIRQTRAAVIIPNQNSTLPKAGSTTMHPNRAFNSYPPIQTQQPQRAIYPNNVYPTHQWQAPKIQSSQFPVHPDVKLKHLPFYDFISELIKPSTLVPQGNQRQQEGTYMFHLTPQQVDSITTSRDVRAGKPAEYSTQIQLRFCLLETTSEQDDSFPPGIQVKVNQKPCTLPNPAPPTKPGAEPKRPPRPVNITPLCKLSPVVPNAIQVQWTTDYTRGYVLAVHLVEKRSSDDLLARLKARGIRAADYTRGMIKDKLKEDGEIATTSLRVSIACPLGKMRMTTPCRSYTCNHFQCFDASLFLQMNEKKPQWMCPVCNKPALYDKLVIDGYFQEVLESTRATPDCTEIQLHMDGLWTAFSVKNEKERVVEKVDPPTPAKKEPVVVETEEKPSSTSNVQIVTLSDSDDDEPLMPKKKQATEVTSSSSLNETGKSQAPQTVPSVITLDEDSPVTSPISAPPPYQQFGWDLDTSPAYRY